MNLTKLSWKNLNAKPLASFLSLLLLAMGVGIISILLLLNKQLEEKFTKNIAGIDMVVGAKGSPLQLILSSIYQIDYPTGNIPLAEANKLTRNPLVKQAIPLAYGDSYQSFRIVGTQESYLKHYKTELQEGRIWAEKSRFEVVLGATAARDLGLKIGETFISSHGLVDDRHQHEAQPFTVVGVLAANNSVVDQLILTNLTSVWAVHQEEEEKTDSEHDHSHGDHAHGHAHEAPEIAEKDQDITALLVSFRSPMGMVQLPRMINHQTNMQAALPVVEVNRLLGLLGVGIETLRAIALAIMLISGISVFVSLYNSLKDRQYELALMRTLGASRGQLFLSIIQESMWLSILGFGLGILMSRIGFGLLSGLAASSYHYTFSVWQFLPAEALLFAVTLLIGFLAALLPALRAFHLNISKTLTKA